jgi:hypothetical protein
MSLQYFSKRSVTSQLHSGYCLTPPFIFKYFSSFCIGCDILKMTSLNRIITCNSEFVPLHALKSYEELVV